MTDASSVPVLHDLVLYASQFVQNYAGKYSLFVWIGVAALLGWIVSRKAGYQFVGWLMLSIVFLGFLFSFLGKAFQGYGSWQRKSILVCLSNSPLSA